jgi:CMP-N,N'-diacetyllegionaminic acid synthase
MNILCTILARGGSKGVPNKNIKNIMGEPLIAHSIKQAKKSNLFSKISVSSDSQDILNIAEKYNTDYLIKRPFELASDFAPKLPALHHCVLKSEELFGNKFDIIIDLDPTSPLRIVDDIINCYNLLLNGDVSNIITASPARRSPYFNLIEFDHNNKLGVSKSLPTKITRRQDAPQCYDMNASIYAWNRHFLFLNEPFWQLKTKLYLMPEERSIDIDSELDYEFVSFIAQKKGYLS